MKNSDSVLILCIAAVIILCIGDYDLLDAIIDRVSPIEICDKPIKALSEDSSNE